MKDPESAKNELLGKAVKDAKEKAAVLTSAGGVTLKDIQSIDYSWGEIEFEVSHINRLMKACAPVPELVRMLATIWISSLMTLRFLTQ